MTVPAVERVPPLVSVILTTRDRPRFLALALAYYRQQTYPRRELIVVDDGERFPADEAAIREAGGRLLRVSPGTLLGTKLNLGIEQARGALCQKMDDDDWYGPTFMETMVAAHQAGRQALCQPAISFVLGFLFFEVARWEVRRSDPNHVPGATLLFAREDWEERPFRALPGDEDTWFLLDQLRSGRAARPVRGPEIFMAVRHRGSRERGHTWTHQWTGLTLEATIEQQPLHSGGPEALLPEWALAVYREIRHELTAGRLNGDAAGP